MPSAKRRDPERILLNYEPLYKFDVHRDWSCGSRKCSLLCTGFLQSVARLPHITTAKRLLKGDHVFR